MPVENRGWPTRRQLLQLAAGTTAAGFAGCVGAADEEPQGGVTIIENYPTSSGTVTAEHTQTATNPGSPTTTDPPDSTDTENTDTETDPETETDTNTETDTSTARQLRIIAADGAEAFEYAFTIDGEAELVTTGEYNAVSKDESTSGRGEEIVENGDGTVTIKGVVANGGGDTFRIEGEIVASEIHGEASVYVDGELVEETDSPPDDKRCVTIDEPGEYVLTGDISSSADVCIEIRSDDVTFDGDGHTITGSNRRGTGISVSGRSVTVRNVTVRGFDVGIEPEGATVQNCVVTENTTGIQLRAPSTVGSVVGSEISHNEGDGIFLEAAEGRQFLIRDSRLVSNGGAGIWATVSLVDVHENVIEGNAGWGVWADDSEVYFDSNEVRSNAGGIHLVGNGFLDNEIVADNRGTGVSIGGEVEVWATSIRDNDGDGLSVGPAFHTDGRATLERTHITGNGENGVVAEGELGIRESTIADNAALGVRYTGDGVADARNNFWGVSDGPSSPDDPDAPFKDPDENEYANGGGDAVSEGDTPGISNVRFTPWLEAEP